jgi:transposase
VRFIDYAGDMKRDGRTLDHRTLEEIRRMAVERVREGEDPSAVIASYGFCRTTIYKWMHASSGRGKGMRALASRKASGRPRTLTAAQERRFCQLAVETRKKSRQVSRRANNRTGSLIRSRAADPQFHAIV